MKIRMLAMQVEKFIPPEILGAVDEYTLETTPECWEKFVIDIKNRRADENGVAWVEFDVEVSNEALMAALHPEPTVLDATDFKKVQ